MQRDILPIVEGCTVSTKYGPVKTDYMLFIAAGAFHVSKITDLIPELMQMVDEKVISIGMGYDISFFDKEVQKWIYEYRKENGILRPEQIEALKAQKNLENMQQYPVIQVLNSALPEPKTNGKVSLSERKLNKYFPSHMPSREREKVILELLAKWKEEQEEMADET